MNRRYSQMALKIWGLSGAVVAMIFVAVIIAASVHNSGINSTNRHIESRHHFWQVVAGQTTPATPTVDNKLALDLRVVINSKHPEQAIRDFRGDSNQYGGITDALGVDPFVGDSCQDCGPLSSYMRTSLDQVKAGNVQAVISSDKPVVSKYSAGWIYILGIVWFVSLPALLFLPTVLRRRKMKTVEEAFPEDGRMLDKLDKALRELSPSDPQYEEFSKLHTKLESALNRQLVSVKDEVAKTRRKELLQEAQSTLAAYEEGNKYLNA